MFDLVDIETGEAVTIYATSIHEFTSIGDAYSIANTKETFFLVFCDGEFVWLPCKMFVPIK